MATLPRMPSAAVRRSLLTRAAYHAVRWAPVVVVALLAFWAFPLPTHLAAPLLRVGNTATETVSAPFYFVVPKSDGERALEGEVRASAARPVYRFDAGAYDSVMIQLDTLFARMDEPTVLSPGEVRSAAASAGVRLTAQEAAYLLDEDRRHAVRRALSDFLAGMLSRGVADVATLRSETSRWLSFRRGDAERLVPRDSILSFADLMAESEARHPGVTDDAGERSLRQVVAALYRPTVVYDPGLTAFRREQLREGVDSVKYAVQAGERIVTRGQPVTQEARDKLAGLQRELRRRGEDTVMARTVAGGALYNAIILTAFWLVIFLYRRETYDQLREMAFFGVPCSASSSCSRGH